MLKSSYIFLIALITLLLFASCAHTTQSQHNSKCIPIFNEILYLQDSRELSLMQLEISAEQYQVGTIPIEEYRFREQRYMNEETKLRARVDKLTKKAKQLNCL